MTGPLRVPPGRAGRVWLLGRLHTAERGLDLLDRKLRVLRREQERARLAAERTGAEWRRRCAEAEPWLLRAALLGGQRALRHAVPGETAQVQVTWAVVMGVRYPQQAVAHSGRPAPDAAPTGTTALVEAAATYRDALRGRRGPRRRRGDRAPARRGGGRNGAPTARGRGPVDPTPARGPAPHRARARGARPRRGAPPAVGGRTPAARVTRLPAGMRGAEPPPLSAQAAGAPASALHRASASFGASGQVEGPCTRPGQCPNLDGERRVGVVRRGRPRSTRR